MSVEPVMTIVRRADSPFLRHSPIALDQTHMAELAALGPVMNMDKKRELLGCLFTTLLDSVRAAPESTGPPFYMKDPPALRAHLKRSAALPDLVRLVVSHENVTRGSAAAAAPLREAASHSKQA